MTQVTVALKLNNKKILFFCPLSEIYVFFDFLQNVLQFKTILKIVESRSYAIRFGTFSLFDTLWNQSKAKVITGGVRTWEKEEKKFFLSWKKPENYYRFQSEQFMAYESHKPRPTIYCDHENSWDFSHFSNIITSWKLPDKNRQGFFILLWMYNRNVRKMSNELEWSK